MGNVIVTISDKKLGRVSNLVQTKAEYYEAIVKTASDYYPFGWQMPNRKLNTENYSFGFNGQLQDAEWMGGQSVAFEFRTYESRLGRFLSTDPLAVLNAHQTPYAFAANSPISSIDYLGLTDTSRTRADGSVKWNGDDYDPTAQFLEKVVVEAKGLVPGTTAFNEVQQEKEQELSDNSGFHPRRDGTGYSIPVQYGYVLDSENGQVVPPDYSKSADVIYMIEDKDKNMFYWVDRYGYATREGHSSVQGGSPMGFELISGVGTASSITKGIGLLNAVRKAKTWRSSAGVAFGHGKEIIGRWLRGTHGNAGFFPKSIAEKLSGKSFKTFDDYREAFWKAVAADPALANQFSKSNRVRMLSGKAPKVVKSQQIPGQTTYQLHHIKPIQHGGSVYSADNIMIVTPRYHKDILPGSYHYGH